MNKNVLSSSLSLTPRAAPRAHGGNMISLASGRGNIGKSWIAAAMAGVLAKEGKKTLLFDADLGLTNIDRQLGIMPPTGLDEVLLNTRPLNTVIVHHDFDIITGRSVHNSLPGMSLGALELIKDDLLLLGAHYDSVITDLGSNIQKQVRFFTGNIGTLLLVVTKDESAMSSSVVFMKELSKANPSADVRLVVNNVSSKDEGEQVYQVLFEAIKKTTAFEPPLSGIILRDPYVPKAIRAKKNLGKINPESPALEDIQLILNSLR